MNFIGIVGARKFKDKTAVETLVKNIPENSTIVTSGCDGVCKCVQATAKERGMRILVFAPDLTGIRSWFDVPKRYYQRNRELIERCDFLHAFISAECGYTGGTRFEIEYAIKLNIPVKIHWEGGCSELIYQNILPFEMNALNVAWQDFFCEAIR